MSVEDEPRPGRPSTSLTDENRDQVAALLTEDRHLILRELTDTFSISFGSCQSIVNELGYRRVASKFVSKILKPEEKANRKAIAQELLERRETDQNF